MDGFMISESVWKFLFQNVPDFRSRFPLHDSEKAFTVENVSDLLESISTGKPLRTKLITVYRELDDRLKAKLYEIVLLK